MKHYLTAEEIADQEEKKKREQEWKVYELSQNSNY